MSSVLLLGNRFAAERVDLQFAEAGRYVFEDFIEDFQATGFTLAIRSGLLLGWTAVITDPDGVRTEYELEFGMGAALPIQGHLRQAYYDWAGRHTPLATAFSP